MSIFCSQSEGTLSQFVSKAFSVCGCFYQVNKRVCVSKLEIMAGLFLVYGAHFVKIHGRGDRTSHCYRIKAKLVADEVGLVDGVNVIDAAVRAE
ncbi:hypothetical protein SDC9_199638 [bioreactor metagenome]|uniref:Uncharacterized protein n=1 Tax=bioreactor metagenome TaxID=1076179 RepID=A0A645ILS5_9ZZZZ